MAYCSATLNSAGCPACPTNAENRCPNVPGYKAMVSAESALHDALDALEIAKSNFADAQAEYFESYRVLD